MKVKHSHAQKTNELVESTIARLDSMLNEVTRDIEERQQRIEDAIWRRVEAEVSFTHAPIMFVIVDKYRHLRRANQAAIDRFGPFPKDSKLTLGETLSCRNLLAFPGYAPSCATCPQCPIDDAIEVAFKDGKRSENVEATIDCERNGHLVRRTYLISTVPFDLAEETFVLVTLQDMTDWKRLQTEVQRARKLSALATLSSGLAHDFNNLLSIIIGYTSLARSEAKAGNDVDLYLTQIEDCAFSAADLSNELLSISCETPPRKMNLSLANTIAHSAYGALLTYETDYTMETEDLWPVEGDPAQLRQAFSAIIVNGAQAMAGGGQLSIKGKNITLDANSAVPLAPGKYVHLHIGDSGPGISTDKLDRIFEPYFSTKENAHGLGLTAAFAIVKRHEGHIALRSTIGKGTVVHIYLPAAQDPIMQRYWEFGFIGAVGKPYSIRALDDLLDKVTID